MNKKIIMTAVKTADSRDLLERLSLFSDIKEGIHSANNVINIKTAGQAISRLHKTQNRINIILRFHSELSISEQDNLFELSDMLSDLIDKLLERFSEL